MTPAIYARNITFQQTLDPLDTNTYSHIWKMERIEDITAQFPFFSKKCVPFDSTDPLNLGVVVNNDKYTIYRSKALGRRGVLELYSHLQQLDLPFPKRVIFMNKEGYRSYFGGGLFSQYSHYFTGMNYFAYEQAEVFRHFPQDLQVAFFHPLNSRVYLSGQNPLEDMVAINIERVADPHIIDYFSPDYFSIIGTRSNFFRVLELILENKEPSLFHCTGGLHRTGMIALAIRNLQGNLWTKKFAHPVAVKVGLLQRTVLLRNLAEVEYYMHNQLQFREKNILSMRTLAYQPEFQNLQKKYRSDLNRPSSCL